MKLEVNWITKHWGRELLMLLPAEQSLVRGSIDPHFRLSITGLGNTRGSYLNSNSKGSELQGIGQFLKPLELYWKELSKT